VGCPPSPVPDREHGLRCEDPVAEDADRRGPEPADGDLGEGVLVREDQHGAEPHRGRHRHGLRGHTPWTLGCQPVDDPSIVTTNPASARDGWPTTPGAWPSGPAIGNHAANTLIRTTVPMKHREVPPSLEGDDREHHGPSERDECPDAEQVTHVVGCFIGPSPLHRNDHDVGHPPVDAPLDAAGQRPPVLAPDVDGRQRGDHDDPDACSAVEVAREGRRLTHRAPASCPAHLQGVVAKRVHTVSPAVRVVLPRKR